MNIYQSKKEVPPRFELGSLDSKSRVLTITPWDQWSIYALQFISFIDCENATPAFKTKTATTPIALSS